LDHDAFGFEIPNQKKTAIDSIMNDFAFVSHHLFKVLIRKHEITL